MARAGQGSRNRAGHQRRAPHTGAAAASSSQDASIEPSSASPSSDDDFVAARTTAKRARPRAAAANGTRAIRQRRTRRGAPAASESSTAASAAVSDNATTSDHAAASDNATTSDNAASEYSRRNTASLSSSNDSEEHTSSSGNDDENDSDVDADASDDGSRGIAARDLSESQTAAHDGDEEDDQDDEGGDDSGNGEDENEGEDADEGDDDDDGADEVDDDDDDDDDDDENEAESSATDGNGAVQANGHGSHAHSRRRAVARDPRAEFYFVKDLDVKAYRRTEAVSRFRYLLALGDLFRKFVDYRAQKDPEFEAILDEAAHENARAVKSRTGSNGSSAKGRGRRASARTSRLADLAEAEDIMEEPDEEEPISVFSESPGFVRGTLRQYQIDGLNWLVSLFLNNINGILADEMGLGKTFQCISFLAYLRHIQGIRGPHLVIVPKSTIQNWAREFERWTPEVDVLVLTGDKHERAALIKNELMACHFDVCITSFELVIREKSALQKVAWQYVIVDEAHRIKNEESILSRIMRVLFSRHRLLITGTPLQNNLHELWALLNFLLPDVFGDAEVFDAWFTQGDESGQDKVIEQLRSLLSPFLMRRVKRDVEHTLLPKKEINLYVGMSDMQIQWYQRLLEKDLDAVNNTTRGGTMKEGKMRLLNVVMQLRKCCNHPYLFDGAEPGPPFTTDEHLVYNSGKMFFLDKLLHRLKEQGSRVLIFSQMGRMLDILEDYCALRDYEYCRIDGSTMHEDRIAAIDEFNRPGSDKFLFLLTTRAGGLGINLTTADQVIIYDSDWNPQADLQAMDRAHRIGQTKQVYVYRFIVEHAIEEKVLERAAHKLRLDQLVIQQSGSGRNSAQEKAKAAASKEELANMIRHGAQEVFDQTKGTMASNMSIEDLIASGEQRTQKLNEKYSGLGLDELKKFTFDKPPTGQIITRIPKTKYEDEFKHHHRRARKDTTYSEDLFGSGGHDSEPESSGGRSTKSGGLRAPKQLPLHDFQFFSKELQELQARELAWYRKQVGIRISSEDYSSDEEDESEERNDEIENAEPLTDEELARKEQLISEGFPNFSKRDFYHFLNLVIRHGGRRNMTDESLDAMCKQWPEKAPDEIKRYHKVFFERYHEIADHERYMNQLEAGESRARRQNRLGDLLRRKVESCRAPLSDMSVVQPSGGSSSRHRFSESNDRFLITQMVALGLDTANLHERIRENIRNCGLFDFDWYFMSRSTVELARRCTSLLNIISKEADGTASSRSLKRKSRAQSSKDTDTEDDASSKRVKEESEGVQ